MRQVARILMLLLLGALAGGILGSIFTGDWIYTIVWAVALPLVFLTAGIVGSGSVKRLAIPTRPGRAPGIISSLPDQRSSTPAAVLNPESTAVPVTGMTLNGVPVTPAATGAGTGAETPDPGRAPTGAPWWSRALAILLIVIGAAVALAPSHRMIAWTFTDLAQGRWDGKDMRYGLHQQEAIDDIAAVVGGYEFTGVFFYDSYVLVDAPTFPGADTTDSFAWRYGRAWRDGPEFIQPSDVDAERFDASSIDFSTVARVVDEARRDTGWTDIVSIYASISRWSGEDPEINVSLATEYHNRTYRFTVQGELLERTGSD